MFKENPFDPVFDCQQVFKTLMNALARPGTIVSMEKNVENWREKTRLFWPQASPCWTTGAGSASAATRSWKRSCGS